MTTNTYCEQLHELDVILQQASNAREYAAAREVKIDALRTHLKRDHRLRPDEIEARISIIKNMVPS
jgi:hypothetical protein